MNDYTIEEMERWSNDPRSKARADVIHAMRLRIADLEAKLAAAEAKNEELATMLADEGMSGGIELGELRIKLAAAEAQIQDLLKPIVDNADQCMKLTKRAEAAEAGERELLTVIERVAEYPCQQRRLDHLRCSDLIAEKFWCPSCIARAALAATPAKEHPEDRCQRCGGRNVTWFAPNEIWNKVMGSGNGILCPACFVAAAETKGISCSWELRPDAALAATPGAPEKTITLSQMRKYLDEHDAILTADQRRRDAEIVRREHLEDPQTQDDAAYDQAIEDAVAAILRGQEKINA